jgi:hypothetical protein
LIIERNQDADFAFASIAIILCCFVSFGLIFLPKILCVIRGRDQTASSTNNKENSTSNSGTAGHGSNVGPQPLSSEDEEKHRKLIAENEQLKTLIAEREARVNELIEKLKQRGSNIVIRDVQRFSGSAGGSGHASTTHEADPSGKTDAAAYVMRRRSTFVNPITLSARVSTVGLATTATIASKSIDVAPDANNTKVASSSSYRESVC